MEKRTKIEELTIGMIAAKNINGKSGYPIVTKGTKLTADHIKKLKENKIIEISVLKTVSSKTAQDANKNQKTPDTTQQQPVEIHNEKFPYETHQFLLDEITRNEIKHLAFYAFHRNYFQMDKITRKEEVFKEAVQIILKDLHLLALLSISKTNQPGSNAVHSQIMVLSMLMGMDFGMDLEQLISLGKAALLYKIGTHTSQLKQKKMKETIGETQADLEAQARAGYELLTKFFDPDVARVALEQHERYDGSGFPNFKSGNELSLMSKIIAVAGKFIYLQVNSHGKKTPTMELAMDYVMNGEGVWYDPNVVNSFRKFVAPFRLGSVVELRDGSLAIVVKYGSAPDYAPMVKIIQSNHSKFEDGDFVETSRYHELMIRRVLSESIR